MRKDFENIYNLNVHRIYDASYRMVGNRQDAEDITQETFATAYQKMDGFRGESKISTWLYTINRNICLRFLQNRRKMSFEKMEELVLAAKQAPTFIMDDLEKRAYIEEVKEGCLTGLVRCLSLNQRLAFVLHVLLEEEISTVAAILDKSGEATRVLVTRAKANIKKFLCHNCSLYQEGNRCQCENLIQFSLNQDWIKKPSGKEYKSVNPVPVETLKANISHTNKLLLLYRSIPFHELADETKKRIKKSWL